MAGSLPPAQHLVIAAAVSFAMVAFGFGLTTLLSSQWVRYDVKEADFVRYSVRQRHFEYYNRTQGPVWACVASTAQVILTKAADMQRQDCFLLIFAAQKNHSAASLVHLRRSQIALKVAAHLITLAGLFAGLVLLMYRWLAKKKPQPRDLPRRWRSKIVVLWCFGALLQLASLALYHAVLGMEKSVQAPNLIHIYSSWEPRLRDNTTITFAIMYGLEWVSTCFLVLAGFSMWLSNVCFRLNPPRHAVQPSIELPERHAANVMAIGRLGPAVQELEAPNWRGSEISLNSSVVSSKPGLKLREAYNNQTPGSWGKNYVLV